MHTPDRERGFIHCSGKYMYARGAQAIHTLCCAQAFHSVAYFSRNITYVAVCPDCLYTDVYIFIARLRGHSKAPPGQYMPYSPAVRAIYIYCPVALTVYTITN